MSCIRSGWCLSCDGDLLLFVADVLTEELHRIDVNEEETHPCRAEVEQMIEQCYYCLYGHPSKRTKAKHLQDHGVTQVSNRVARCSPVIVCHRSALVPDSLVELA